MPENSIDAIVTDPPAAISFMGREWDSDKGGRLKWIAWMAAIATECLRVLKPGGHALVWSLPRTSHWTAAAWEESGFEVRDCILFCFGTGFPKSLDVSKAIDREAGAGRDIVGYSKGVTVATEDNKHGGINRGAVGIRQTAINVPITIPATVAAKQWDGWGTALKPAIEIWLLCRKPLDGTVAENTLKWGVGGLNIDGARIETEETIENHSRSAESAVSKGRSGNSTEQATHQTRGQQIGRWPSNLIHDGSEEVVGMFPETKSPATYTRNAPGFNKSIYGQNMGQEKGTESLNYGDSGSAARFFYHSKASRQERWFYCRVCQKVDIDRGQHEAHVMHCHDCNCDYPREQTADSGMERMNQNNQTAGYRPDSYSGKNPHEGHKTESNLVQHPTQKPISLMTYLARLITPPNGLVLDPFLGSGSTGVAVVYEGFRFIGIDLDKEYCEIAAKRIEYALAHPLKEKRRVSQIKEPTQTKLL